jgi:hypothetical protein
MRQERAGRIRVRYGLALAAALLAGVPLVGCLLPMDPVPTRDLTFEGRVSRASDGAPVPGARVEVWTSSESVGTFAPLVEGQTNPAGEFVVSRAVRTSVRPQDPVVRVTPPAGSGLQTELGEFPSHTASGRRSTYATQVLLRPGS